MHVHVHVCVTVHNECLRIVLSQYEGKALMVRCERRIPHETIESKELIAWVGWGVVGGGPSSWASYLRSYQNVMD